MKPGDYSAKCGKRWYPRRQLAERALLSARIAGAIQRNGGRRKERRAYLCPDCHGWHLTSR